MKPDQAKALMLAKRQLSELVCDAVNLEGINFTLLEIQTLLEGITVGGYKLSHQRIAVNQGEAWRTLFEWIANGRFQVTAKKVCKLHQITGKEKALECGRFRSGGVTIAGTDYMPPEAGMLRGLFDNMVDQAYKIPDIAVVV